MTRIPDEPAGSSKGRALPERGLPRDEVLRLLDAAKKDDAPWRRGRIWSLVYDGGEEHEAFLKEAHNLYFSENALNPLAFKSLKNLEADVVATAAELLGGDGETVGTVTSGGTESCLLAAKTWRDYARKKRPFLRNPEIVLAESAHVAWLKAAEYFDLKVRSVGLDSEYRLDTAALRAAINRRTVLVVASAPDYPHGIIDPIEEIGRTAIEAGVPLHVDACVGGFLLPFLEELGEDLPPYDFRVPGVLSVSADVHKYGYGAKGASVIIYRNVNYLEHQFFVEQNWPGGIFMSPGLLGTRPGGPIAAAWAAVQYFGRQGYRENARIIGDTTRRLLEGIGEIPELEILGRPRASLFSFRTKNNKPDIYLVGDFLEAAGWHVDRLQRPEALHAMVMLRHAGVVDDYLRDLKEALGLARKNPGQAGKGNAALYGMAARLPLRSLVKAEILKTAKDLYRRK